MRKIIISAFILISLSCNSDKKRELIKDVTSQFTEKSKVKYAKGFGIQEYENYKIITLKNAWVGADASYKYVLYNNKKPIGVEATAFIKTPIKSIACMSLTHIAFIKELELENSVIALSGCDYVSNIKVKERIESERIKEIGTEQNINYEMLVDESPSLIMAYGIDESSNKYINKLKELGLTIVLNAEYMETHPLGKAEWIKFIAAFYNREEDAEKIFNKIEKEYLDLLELTKNVNEKPTVFTGMPWNDAWYIAGAKSFQVQLFKDAGAQYLWLDNEETSSLVKAKEVIIDEAYDADFWLNQNSYNSISSIIGFDNKLKGFKAIKKEQLFNNNKRVNLNSGNDYWESGVVHPQVILKDLIKIFHPQLIEHELYYYKRME